MSFSKQQLQEMLEQVFEFNKIHAVDGVFAITTTNKLHIQYLLDEDNNFLEILASGDPINDSKMVDAYVFCNEYKSPLLQPYFLTEDKSVWTKFCIMTKDCSLPYIYNQIHLANMAINDFFDEAKQL